MAKIINGRILAEKIKNKIIKEIIKINNNDLSCPKRPGLAIILIGEREDSKLYVKMKEKEAKKIGIETSLYKFDKNASEKEILKAIKFLNKDKAIDAILVQLPLPEKMDAEKIINSISPEKDVDRFHPENRKMLLESCNHNHVMPPVYASVLEMLKSINFDLKNKKAVIIANSDIFGKGLEKTLKCLGAKVETTGLKDKNFKKSASKADLLISAVGKPGFIKKEMIKKGAIIIDIGITKKDKTVFGDVDFNDVKNKASYISPVPGGIGPMTIAMLFKNTISLWKK
jgi:methylenetetrahydrofolate dehydrogenase (NADP+) / methenyltetrahydrofolate cyclohydrolase